jgi:dihydrolipoamide dehydrogenase
MSFQFDVVIIGSGPGGYVAGIRAAQLGLKTAVIEKYSTLGGTCLNVGCIPSKALLDSSEHYHNAEKNFAVHGIGVEKLNLDLKQMIKRKNDVVSNTTSGIEYLFKKNKITRFEGHGSFVDDHTLKVTNGSKEELITAKDIIIATGSKPVELPFAKFDKERIISSTEALNITTLPKQMIIIGGGVIGLELGSVYARLGTKVTIIEFMDSIIATMDRQLGRTLQRSLKKLDMVFELKTKVTSVSRKGKVVTVDAENKKGEKVTFKGDYCVVAVGRKPYTAGLNLDAVGVQLNERGFVQIDKNWQTSKANIYAIGDVVPGPMLAHKAEEEGVAVAEFLAGEKPHMNYNTIPGVVYTWPEVASVGKTEEELKAANVAYKIGNFPFKASGRARASEESDGFVKVLADKSTDEILGVHMIGPRAADMIAEAVVAMEYRASAEDIGRIVHAHPTFTEALKDAALMASADRAIHS